MPNSVEQEAYQCCSTWCERTQLDVPEHGAEQLSLSNSIGVHAGYVPEFYSV